MATCTQVYFMTPKGVKITPSNEKKKKVERSTEIKKRKWRKKDCHCFESSVLSIFYGKKENI